MPVRISRTSAHDTLGIKMQRLSDDLRPCEREILENSDVADSINNFSEKSLFNRHPDGLSHACRLFGTTNYKGRFRFSFARLKGISRWMVGGETCEGGKLRPPWAIPNDKSKVPGRKFYLHHNSWHNIRNNQDKRKKIKNNKSVEALDKGNEFQFDIFLENLEAWELGLLLYCLELESNMGHKLGMEKPLGVGSVKIEIENLSILNVTDDHTKWSPSEDKIADYIAEGVKKLKEYLGEKWHDLRALLWIPEFKTAVIYPALNDESKESITNYAYKKLSNTDILPLKTRVENLKKLWRSWNID